MDMQRLLERASWDFIDLAAAKLAWIAFRIAKGLSGVAVPLLTMPDGNAKMEKTAKSGVNVCGLALASSDLSGFNVCRYATKLCRAFCLAYAGHNDMPYARKAQIVKTQFLADNPSAFYTLLMWEIGKAEQKFGSTLRIRLNMLSDLTWETLLPEIFERYPTVRFYDYTKHPLGSRVLPANYELTQSASERTSVDDVADMVEQGARVAVVLSLKPSEPMIDTWHGMRVVDGDATDDRWLNAGGQVIGLRAKGRLRKDGINGFVKAVA